MSERIRTTYRFLQSVQLASQSRADRLIIPVVLALGVIFLGLQILAADWALVIVTGVCLVGLFAVAVSLRLQRAILGRAIQRIHAIYMVLVWFCFVLAVILYRVIEPLPAFGKDSRLYYVLLIALCAVIFRAISTLVALSRFGYDLYITRIPLWEQVLLVINEFIAAGFLAYVLGGELARWLQTDVFTVRFDPLYSLGMLSCAIGYYLVIQMMWFQRWNNWLSRNTVWVRLARIAAPWVLLVATVAISRHFGRLSDRRTADLLGTAGIDQAVLALSPVIWMIIFSIVILVYTGNKGLRARLLPPILLDKLPYRLNRFFSTVSDMDILLVIGLLCTTIPAQIFLFNNVSTSGIIDTLRQQIAEQNALIDSSEQALSFIFALPFYILAVGMLAMYAYVVMREKISAHERERLVDRLPIGLLIIFIIVLYLCAIPFSQVLTEGRLPSLGRVLAYDILIPIILLYVHYFIFIRVPYGRGQSAWRVQESKRLEFELLRTDRHIRNIDMSLVQAERTWAGDQGTISPDRRIAILHRLLELNGKRDQYNMERLQILSDKQQLAEVSETPVAVAIAKLPTRIVTFGIPIVLAFKIYEWAIVNDGLREVANNPNIGVLEFFRIILEETQF